ncbi:hypothetical protein ZHAS_00013578 [Anopheles sinensis]|uniref:Uncharacterized protein n=1 Tax=Anopheles sinensis TaxID=74873 RepID=A0A084W5U6_ANOSI|nr:hypothetical protein ZHAS_00013578 [Anopheles sinensis]
MVQSPSSVVAMNEKGQQLVLATPYRSNSSSLPSSSAESGHSAMECSMIQQLIALIAPEHLLLADNMQDVAAGGQQQRPLRHGIENTVHRTGLWVFVGGCKTTDSVLVETDRTLLLSVRYPFRMADRCTAPDRGESDRCYVIYMALGYLDIGEKQFNSCIDGEREGK